MATKMKPRSSTISPAVLISAISLLVSCATFYISQIRIHDKLIFVVTPLVDIQNADRIEYRNVMPHRAVLINKGNRPEIVLSLHIEIVGRNSVYSGAGYGNLILQPGEIKPVEFSDSADNIATHMQIDGADEGKINFTVRYIDPSGNIAVSTLPLGSIKKKLSKSDQGGTIVETRDVEINSLDQGLSYVIEDKLGLGL